MKSKVLLNQNDMNQVKDKKKLESTCRHNHDWKVKYQGLIY